MKKMNKTVFASVFFAACMLIAVTSCKNLFNPLHEIEHNSEIEQQSESTKSTESSSGNGLSAGPQKITVSLGASTNQTSTPSRSVFPTGYNPADITVNSFTSFTLTSSEPISGKNVLSWSTYDAFSHASIELDTVKTYVLTLSATYKGGTWSSNQVTWNKTDRTIQFTLKPTGEGTLGVSLDITEVAEQAETIRFWISDSPVINRSTDPIKTFDPLTGTDTPITWQMPACSAGKHYALFEILDKNGASTIVGPESIYILPGQSSVWSQEIELLNRKYKITFSQEGFDYDDREKPVAARLVEGAVIPGPWVQNIYETTPELPNDWNSDLGMEDLFIPPAGYEFSYWWDGENEWWAGDTIYGDASNHDVTLYPLWQRGSYIYNSSTEEEINNFIQRETEDETKTEITVSFESDTPLAVWNTAFSALAAAGQSKPVVLNLQNVDIDWFATNICPDPENPDAAKTFARIAGTSDTPNTWIKQIRVPLNTKKIPDYAFYNCTALEQIIYDTAYTITEIGDYAFAKDKNFTSIYNRDKGEGCPTSQGLVIGKGAFSESGITSIPTSFSYTTASGLKPITIGDEAYKDCQSLTSIEVNVAIAEIGAKAFEGCSNLTSVVFKPHSTYSTLLKTIGEGAFAGTAITAIEIPYSVTTIGDSAFAGLTNLTTVTFETSTNRKLTKIGTNAFRGTGITAIEIPNSVTTIGDSAFQECTSLAAVTIDSTASKLKTIGELAFEKCAFTTFTLPATVTSMGRAAFAKNTALTEFKFASNYKLHKIPAQCFYECTNFSTISLGASITYVDYDAFVGTKSDNLTSGNLLASTWTTFTLDENYQPIDYTREGLVSNKIKANVNGTTRERYVRDFSLTVNTADEIYDFISECSTLPKTIPLGIAGASSSFSWSDFKEILDGIENTNEYGIYLMLTDIQIPESAPEELKVIPDNLLKNKTWLKQIALPHAFSDYPYMTAIGENAFSGCTNLTEVSNLNDVTRFGENAFAGCTSLTTLSGLGSGSWYAYNGTSKTLAEYTSADLSTGLKGTGGRVSAFIKDAAPAEAIAATNLVDLVKSKTNTASSHFDLTFFGEIASVFDLSPLQNLTVGVEGATIGLDLSQVTITGTSSTARTLPDSFFQGYTNIASEDTPYTYEGDPQTAIALVLKSIKLPQNLESIETWAFAYSPKLESVSIPATVKTLNGNTFCAAESLNSVTFESGSQLITIGSEAFYHTPALTAITLPETLEQIDSRAFRDSSITSIIIPDSTDFKRGTPGEFIFADCTSLTSVTIGSGVTVMDRSFEGCTNLENLTIKGDGRWYANFKNEISGIYNQTITEVSSNTELIDLLKTDNATRRSALYRNAQLSTVISNATDLINTMSSYFDLNYKIAISVPFSNWSDLNPLKDITLGNGHTCTIDLSSATTTTGMPENFLNGKDSITVIPPGGTAATVSFTYDLEGFSFKSSFSYPAEGDIGSGTYQINQFEQDDGTTYGTLLLYNLAGVSESDLKEYLKTIILKYSDKAPLNPTEKVNYTLSEGLMEEYNTITETQEQDLTDNDLFKILTYTVHLGSCDGEQVTFDTSSGSVTQWSEQYEWEVIITNGTADCIIYGYEGSWFPFGHDQFINDILSKTTAKDKTSIVSVTLPTDFLEGKTTVYWIDGSITSEEELINAASDGGTYALGANIEVSEPIPIYKSLSLLSVAGNTYTIWKTDGEWNPEDPEDPENSLAAKPLFYTDEENDNSNISLTMENIILDGGSNEDIKGSDSGLLDFGGNKITLTNVIFQNNWKDWDWSNFSGLNLNCSTATLDNCTFQNLHISGGSARAPGINIIKGDVTIKDCLFGNNTVNDEGNDAYQYGRDIWIDESYSGNKVIVTGTTRHLEELSYLEIGSYNIAHFELGNETGKIKLSLLCNKTVAAGLTEYGLEESSVNYNHGSPE